MFFIEKIGHLKSKLSNSFTDIFFFAGMVLLRMVRRKTYSSAMRTVLVNQIYFTSVQILPIFIDLEIGKISPAIFVNRLQRLSMNNITEKEIKIIEKNK